MMIAYYGQILLVSALILASYTVLFSWIKKFGNSTTLIKLVNMSVIGQFLLCTIAFFLLIYAHIISDFSLLNVFANSHTMQPLIYKITGSWGNHEGSLLLWIFLLTLINLLFHFNFDTDQNSKIRLAIINSTLVVGFLVFIIFTSNPFAQLISRPINGLGLNPLLQDVGLAIHPPILYLGYVTSICAFAVTIDSLIKGNFSQTTAQKLHKWILLSWIFLTSGIALGSWWAYRELGWGGFWFWDPVENAALMPWLLNTALFHSNLVACKKNTLKNWTIILAISTFNSSLLGTFLVRSGILTSIHTFAFDPARGIYIFIFLSIVTIVSFTLFAIRACKISTSKNFIFLSKETGILLNNLFMIVLFTTILLSIVYPLTYEYFYNQTISVSEPYFVKTFLPISALMILFCSIIPLYNWGNLTIRVKHKITYISVATILISLLACLQYKIYETRTIIYLVVSIMLVSSGIIDFFLRAKPSIAMSIGHIALAILAISITVNGYLASDKDVIVTKNDQFNIDHYRAKVEQLSVKNIANYKSLKAKISINDNYNIVILNPELRFYPIADIQTSESSIKSNLFGDIYTTISAIDKKNRVILKIYIKPFINIVWFAAILLVISGFVGIFERR